MSGCLVALNCLKNADFSSEVIVVDNHSNDGKLKEFSKQFPSVHFIENNGNYGFSNGNNLGVEKSSGEYLMFLNPDTIVNLPAISEMLNTAKQHPEYHILSCQQTDEKENDEYPFGTFPSFKTLTGINRAFYRLLMPHKAKLKCKGQSVIFPDWVSGSLILIPEKILRQAGGWDEDYWLYSEDVDLCKRVSDQGGKVALLCDIRIIHQHGGVTRQNIKLKSYTKTQVLISRHIYIKKHFKGLKRAIFQIYLVIYNILGLLIPAVLGLLFYFIPELRVYFHLFIQLARYYIQSLIRRSWMPDSNSVDFPVN